VPCVLQRLVAALSLSVHSLAGEVGALQGVSFSPATQATITELLAEKVGRSAQDLEAFAQHAKRTTITSDDVKLLTRRNPELNARVTALAREQGSGASGARKTGGGSGPGGGGGGARRKARDEAGGEQSARPSKQDKKSRDQAPLVLID